MFQPAHGFVENILLPAPGVAGDLAPLDADQGRGIAQAAQAGRHLLRDELAIGEKLKVTVRMRREQVEQLRVHERFAAQNAEKSVPVPFGIGDGAVQRMEIDAVSLLDIHPAALATQIARIEDGEVKERRKIFAALDAPLELFHRQHPLHAEVPEKLRDAPLVSGAQGSEDECREHFQRAPADVCRLFDRCSLRIVSSVRLEAIQSYVACDMPFVNVTP